MRSQIREARVKQAAVYDTALKQNKWKHPTEEDRVYRLLSPPWLSVKEGMEGGKRKEKG